MSDGIHSMPTRSIMPGGGVAKRPLHVILLADCSGSMTGAPIHALNFAIGGMLQHFAEWEQEQDKKIMVRELLAVPAARDALRIAIAIGDHAKSDALTKFIGNSNLPVLVAGDVHQ
ncbi:MAG TPA: hypothetical protein VLX31_07960, partial [Streptosporangiaceae bacterium]|nr:hypothetical protein [Streptosporangiaceae bacterium]